MRFSLFIFCSCYIPISALGSVYFLLSDVEEFVFSSWYFLIFYIIKSSSGSLPTNISSLSAEIANKLADKLSVSSSVFIINNIQQYEESSPFLSLNMSLVSPFLPNTHSKLVRLNKDSPFFNLSSVQLEVRQRFSF